MASFETIIESVDALSPAELDALQALGKECGFIPFVFVPKPHIEESTWSALDEEDHHPTSKFSVASKHQEKSTTVNTDLDTGSRHL